mmetsp:Transcript_32101/g.73340  ORF Transcript_32101/g.73340 Transcript_32101/m.73340 type:complete len:672 (-) Transcript_32101:142-2157(-)
MKTIVHVCAIAFLSPLVESNEFGTRQHSRLTATEEYEEQTVDNASNLFAPAPKNAKSGKTKVKKLRSKLKNQKRQPKKKQPNPLEDGVDYRGQTFRFCTPGLDCPVNPKLHRYDEWLAPGIDAASRNLEPGQWRNFTQAERQFAFTHPEEFAPVRFISKGDSGIEPLQDHPNKDTLASEVLNREVPVPVFTSLGFSHYNHYTVEEILANGENETGEDENGNPLRIRDYMPADGLLILHEGKIVYENYFDHDGSGVKVSPMKKYGRFTRHRMFSATKSLTGTLVNMLAEDGSIHSLDDKITEYIPFLKESKGFKDATIRELLDMTISIAPGTDEDLGCDFSDYEKSEKNARRDKYGYVVSEDLVISDCVSGVLAALSRQPTLLASGATPDPPFALDAPYYIMSDSNPVGNRAGLQQMRKGKYEPGDRFEYLTQKTEVLGWLADTLTNYSSAEYFSEKIWSKLGAESDAVIEIDDLRFNWWGGGVAATLRDAGRFGEAIRLLGKNAKGDQVIPESVIEDVRNNGNASQYALSTYSVLNCLVEPRATYTFDGTNFFECSNVTVTSWLEAMDYPTDGTTKTNLGYTYRNQFRSIVDKSSSQSGTGVMYLEGVHGQNVWIDQNAKLTIARFGSGNPNFSNSAPDNAAGPASLDMAKARAFYEIAAYFIENIEDAKL